jgi:small subunit ribosomal protein S9
VSDIPATPLIPPHFAPSDPPAATTDLAAAAPAAPPESQPQPAPRPSAVGGAVWGTGRRKSSVARVRLLPGEGKVLINKRELSAYFTEEVDRAAVTAPLQATESLRSWNVFVNVNGGGHTGQSRAIKLGVARALLKVTRQPESTLRDAGYLPRDSREVERKKYGRRKARRRFQFSKR